MAQVDRIVAQASDVSGVFQVIAVVEDTQVGTDPRGRPSPTVVAVRLVNTSNRQGLCNYQTPNGQFTNATVLPGENAQSNISPPQRVFYHLWAAASRISWGG